MADAFSQDFTPTTEVVQVNVLYFLSLTLALSVSSLCILGKQWIKEFQRDMAVSARDALRVRQARYDALQAWKVPQILAALPVILQAALLLFFAGLLTQLWNVSEHTTAGVISAAVGMTLLVLLITTVTPAHCTGRTLHERFTPFRSTQAWIYFVAVRFIGLAVRRVLGWVTQTPREHFHNVKILASWVDLDNIFLSKEISHAGPQDITSIHSSLRWVLKVLGNTNEIENSAMWALLPQFHPPSLVQSTEQLTQYVLSEQPPSSGDSSTNTLRLYYDYATTIRDPHRDNIVLEDGGNNRSNLLRAIARHALERIKAAQGSSKDIQDMWQVLTDSCRKSVEVVDESYDSGNLEVSFIRSGKPCFAYCNNNKKLKTLWCR